MSDGQWYVRFAGRVTGPFDLDRVRTMARRGAITRMHFLSKDGKSWLVHVGGELVYVLALVPVQGRHGIKLMQTINGKLTPVDGAHGSPSQALEAGLSALRDKLGW